MKPRMPRSTRNRIIAHIFRFNEAEAMKPRMPFASKVGENGIEAGLQ